MSSAPLGQQLYAGVHFSSEQHQQVFLFSDGGRYVLQTPISTRGPQFIQIRGMLQNCSFVVSDTSLGVFTMMPCPDCLEIQKFTLTNLSVEQLAYVYQIQSSKPEEVYEEMCHIPLVQALMYPRYYSMLQSVFDTYRNIIEGDDSGELTEEIITSRLMMQPKIVTKIGQLGLFHPSITMTSVVQYMMRRLPPKQETQQKIIMALDTEMDPAQRQGGKMRLREVSIVSDDPKCRCELVSSTITESTLTDVRQKLRRGCVVGCGLANDLSCLGVDPQTLDVIDLMSFPFTCQNLKASAFIFLERIIQSGRHSATEDARATLDIFKYHSQFYGYLDLILSKSKQPDVTAFDVQSKIDEMVIMTMLLLRIRCRQPQQQPSLQSYKALLQTSVKLAQIPVRQLTNQLLTIMDPTGKSAPKKLELYFADCVGRVAAFQTLFPRESTFYSQDAFERVPSWIMSWRKERGK